MRPPLLIELDKRQAEWVVVAYLSDDPTMIKVHQEGLDPHAMTGSLISSIPISVIKEESEIVGHETNPDIIAQHRITLRDEVGIDLSEYQTDGFIPRNMSIRQMGKKSNHALNYDMSYRRFALENETPERDAKQIVPRYYLSYPGIKNRFHADVRHQLEKNRTLTNCFGRKRRFLNQWGDDLFKAAYDFLPQSTVGEMINFGCVHVYRHETEIGVLQLATQVHDSILLEAFYDTEEQLYEALKRVEEAITPTLEYNGYEFTIATDGKAGYSWGSKGMKDLSIENFESFAKDLAVIESTYEQETQ